MSSEYVVWYLIGCCIAYGVVGGIRDEMDGIGDMVMIVFWPIALACVVICKVVVFFNNIGRSLR